MTIDEAIKYADMIADEGLSVFDITVSDLQSLGTVCADALRTAKQMSDKPKGEPAVPDAPDTWQNRMKREYHETKERYEKLHRAVTKYKAGTLNFTQKCSIDLLKQQKRHMGEYLHDLEIRAEIEGVDLYD